MQRIAHLRRVSTGAVGASYEAVDRQSTERMQRLRERPQTICGLLLSEIDTPAFSTAQAAGEEGFDVCPNCLDPDRLQLPPV